MAVINISPYCSAGHSQFYTNEALGIKGLTNECLLKAMKSCYQFENINMYEHGVMVHEAYLQLIDLLESGMILEGLPEELIDVYQINKDNLFDIPCMKFYQTYHDCGKPYCKTVDEDGKQHFPNHAQVSYNKFKEVFPDEEAEQMLILHDMDFHTLKPDELKELANSEYGFSLYLTAWAELIANSSMFGGFDSVSFKIKRKKLMKSLKLFRESK